MAKKSPAGPRPGESNYQYVVRRLTEEEGNRGRIAQLAEVGYWVVARIVQGAVKSPGALVVDRLFATLVGLERGELQLPEPARKRA